MKEKIKVIWICYLSNPKLRNHLRPARWTAKAVLRRLFKKHPTPISDFAVWNTNAIREFEKFQDIELHVVSPHARIGKCQEFTIDRINYHIFPDENDSLYRAVLSRIFHITNKRYRRNSHQILNVVNKVRPDIIHMIGAENPFYGESAMLLPSNIPFIVSLQTMMNDPDFFKNYPITKKIYEYRASVEAKILNQADYIGTKLEYFRNIILNYVNPNAKFLDISLAVEETINLEDSIKEYDFVYFAEDVSKAVDYAIEAFAILKDKYPNITLHIVGGYSDMYLKKLQLRMEQLNIQKNVDFTGRLKTHEDVIREIRKSRFAILPLKIDLLSGTIREAMANGLPVVTTITPLTPSLNEEGQSVLLSEKGDFEAMAENMRMLLEDESLVKEMKENAVAAVKQKYNSSAAMLKWKESYFQIMHERE